ncbi:protein of unknown function [Azospirillum baldaniorum]|uniref:Uncharacterized protein n=1 Tax=Azospirillum baldaniorum TaxID=1064539 RepID=A0A9P1JRA8_9PROT|nr:protein of unknown function [Azospirillum baldaniorum]
MTMGGEFPAHFSLPRRHFIACIGAKPMA